MTRAFVFLSLTMLAGTGYTKTMEPHGKPWDKSEFDSETGMIWKVSGDTAFRYRIVPLMTSWRTAKVCTISFQNGSTLVLRNKFTLMANWFETGCENRYLGAAAAPSVEWWNPRATWHVYGSIGGGLGFLDAQGVPGGEGQNFTLNWFGQLGVSQNLSPTWALRTGAMFQHLSNGGQTNPNPGLNCLGLTVGLSRSF